MAEKACATREISKSFCHDLPLSWELPGGADKVDLVNYVDSQPGDFIYTVPVLVYLFDQHNVDHCCNNQFTFWNNEFLLADPQTVINCYGKPFTVRSDSCVPSLLYLAGYSQDQCDS